MKSIFYFIFCVTSFTCCSQSKQEAASSKPENIIILTLDGMRWQEVFKGIDTALVNDKKFTKNKSQLLSAYWDEDLEIRRKKLFPFLWTEINRLGILAGNREYDNKIDNKNPYWFSYPGYNEIFTGFPDSAVHSNDKKYNSNVSVLEYLQNTPDYKNKIAVFATWDVFPFIFNQPRSGIYINADTTLPSENDAYSIINDLQRLTTRPLNVRPDLLTYIGAREYIKKNKPKVMYIAFDETDDFAHAGSYDQYIASAHAEDAMIADLWHTVQSMDEYKDHTSLLITCDHGRGDKVKSQWQHHGSTIQDAHEIWMACMGPKVPNVGELKTSMQLYQAQLAATIADLLGQKYTARHPIFEKIDFNALRPESNAATGGKGK